MGTRVKALVLPIFRRHWLWNAWSDQTAQGVGQKTLRHWREGSTLEEKFSLAGMQVSDKIQHRLVGEWNKLERAKEGSLRNRIYRLAQGVLSREDPQESFLKAVPTDHGELQIIYPADYTERLIRRRLRLVVQQGRRRHRRRLMLWILAMVPQIPLMVTPLPNVTVYYTVYRIWSHMSALQGSRALDKGFAALDSQQLAALRDELLRLQAATGIVYPPESWPARLIKKESRYLDIFDSLRRLQKQRRLEVMLEGGDVAPVPAPDVPTAAALLNPITTEGSSSISKGEGISKGGGLEPSLQLSEEKSSSDLVLDQPQQQAEHAQHAQHGEEDRKDGQKSRELVPTAPPPLPPITTTTTTAAFSGTGMRLIFTGSKDLSELVKPADRVHSPLSNEAAMAVGKAFGVPHLLDFVARARKRAVGSMFPAHSSEW